MARIAPGRYKIWVSGCPCLVGHVGWGRTDKLDEFLDKLSELVTDKVYRRLRSREDVSLTDAAPVVWTDMDRKRARAFLTLLERKVSR